MGVLCVHTVCFDPLIFFQRVALHATIALLFSASSPFQWIVRLVLDGHMAIPQLTSGGYLMIGMTVLSNEAMYAITICAVFGMHGARAGAVRLAPKRQY